MNIFRRLFKPNIAKLERRQNLSGLLKAVHHPDQAIRYASTCALLRLGATGELIQIGSPVVDLLTRALAEDDSVRQTATWALRQIGDVHQVELRPAEFEHREARRTESVLNRSTILYVDDNRENRLLIRRVLEAEGCSVIEAEDGLEGLELATQIVPDVILLDINMPEMDGYQVAKRLKEDKITFHIPIIAVTANVMAGDRERTLEAGCDMYIFKPIDVDLLPDQVSSILKGREWE